MIKAPANLQDLRRGIYVKRKAEPIRSLFGSRISVGSGGVRRGTRVTVESRPGLIGIIKLGAKCAGKRRAGNPHAAFEVAGAGNGSTAGAH